MTEARTVRQVVILLGLTLLLLAAGLIGLAFLERPIPEGLMTLTGTALGALGSMLVSTRSGTTEPVSVTAVEPLPVQEVTDRENDLGAGELRLILCIAAGLLLAYLALVLPA